MAPTGQHPASSDEWLTIHQAARLIGVSPATLRRWSDAGQIEAFTTPGGHRRFSRRAVEAMLPTVPGERSLGDLGETPERLARVYRRVVGRMVAGTPWATATDDPAVDHYRDLGLRISRSLLTYLDAPDVESRQAALVVAETACRDYGQLAVESGAGLGDTVELFIRMRSVFLREMTSLARRRGLDTGGAIGLVEATDRAFDQLLRAVIAGYQETASPDIAASPVEEPRVPASPGRGLR